MNGLAGTRGISTIDQIELVEETPPMIAEDIVEEELVTPITPAEEDVEATEGELLADKESPDPPLPPPAPTEQEAPPLAPQVGDETIDTENYGRGKCTRFPDTMNLSTLLDEDNLILTQLTVKKGLAKHGKLAEESI